MAKGAYPALKTEPGEYPLVVTAAQRRTSSTYQLEGPAVCVPLISSTGHGDAALHRIHYQEGRFALANLLVALLPKEAEVSNAKYLYYLLTAKKEEYLVSRMIGTANVSLKVSDIASVEVALPGISEQRRIVARIEELAGKLAEARRLQGETETDIRRMLLSAYTEITGDVPSLPMGQVAPLIRRPVQVELSREYHEVGIRSFGKGAFHKPSVDGASLGNKKIFRIEAGDLLFNIVFAWEGAVAVARDEDHGRIGSHRFLTCVPKDGLVMAPFLCFHFLTERGLQQLGEASPGGAGRNRTLGTKALARILVPIPPLAKQIWFDTLLTKVDAVKRLQAETAAELDAMLPSILDKAFKGEL